MSEYIITTEQIKEAAKYTPPFKTLSYVAKYKVSGDLDMQGIVVHSLPEIVRCCDCLNFDMSRQSELNEQAFYCRHRCSYELEDGWCYMGVRA